MDKPSLTRRSTVAMVAVAAGAVAAGEAGAARPRSPAQRKALLAPYVVNIDSWFGDDPFPERFAKAAALGFTQIEFWPARREGFDAAAIRRLADAAGLKVAQFAPSWPKIGDPKTHPAFLQTVREACADAQTLGCKLFTVVGHEVVDGMSASEMVAGYTAALRSAAPILESAGITAMVEPFNPYNHPGYFLYGSQPAVAILRAVNSPNVKLLADLFHMQRGEGEVVGRLRTYIDQTAYVQFADSPDRNHPGTGELNYAYIFKEARAAGYQGPFAAELWPKDGDAARAAEDMIKVAQAAGLV